MSCKPQQRELSFFTYSSHYARIRLGGLRAIDWSKKNAEWENVCIVANSVVSNRQARAATKAYIKFKLGMPLSEAELRSIGKAPKAMAAVLGFDDEPGDAGTDKPTATATTLEA